MIQDISLVAPFHHTSTVVNISLAQPNATSPSMSDNWQHNWDLPSDLTFDDDYWAQLLAEQPTLSPVSYPVIGYREDAEVGLAKCRNVRGRVKSKSYAPQDPITGRFPCSYTACTKDFKRPSDRSRHIASIHQRGSTTQTTIRCPIPACRRSHGRGLSRPDKLTEHLRKVHNIRNTQSRVRGADSVAGNNNNNAGYAQGLGGSSITGNVAAVVPVATFGASSNVYNNQVRGGTNSQYSYGMNTSGIAEDLTSTNAVDIASIFSTDQLQGGVDIGIVGDSGAFDIANFNIGQAQDISIIGMADATNFISDADISQLPREVDAGLDARLADMEWADEFAAGMPADWPAELIEEWSNEMI
ncbi:hypothetical protein CJF31_00010553 [Rutstroemia sp. NJR-2017a BVV2]|nr:hypothetical protein CJF31_00010553 [Rutstroemia sp. NJR-2017a BVV2]